MSLGRASHSVFEETGGFQKKVDLLKAMPLEFRLGHKYAFRYVNVHSFLESVGNGSLELSDAEKNA